MSGIGAAVAGGVAAGGVGGLLGILGGHLNKQDQLEQGYDVVEMPQYPWAPGAQENVNQYWTDMMQSMSRGERPDWLRMTLDPMKAEAQGSLYDKYWGTEGRPGVWRAGQDMASLGGVGPKGLVKMGQQMGSDFMSEANKIDQYFNSLGFGAMSNMAMQAPSRLSAMARGPESQIVNYMGGGGAGGAPGFDMSGFQGMAGNVGQAVGDAWGQGQIQGWWNSMMPNGGNVFGQGGSNYPGSQAYSQFGTGTWTPNAPLQQPNQRWGGMGSPVNDWVAQQGG